jgi:hypothetical protein
MEMSEILHRAGIALRDRLYKPEWARTRASDLAREMLGSEAREEVQKRVVALTEPVRQCPSLVGTLHEGQGLLKGEWRLFDKPVRLSDPPNWFANPLTGEEWPDVPSKRIDYRRSDIAGGAKYVWELGRLTFLHTLAVCYALTSDEQFAERFERWLLHFCDHNPLGRGVHHASGIEQGVRNLVILYSLSSVLRAGREVPDETFDAAVGLCIQQALHLRGHLSRGSSGNNHLVAELAGVVVVASCLAGVRGLRREAMWESLLHSAWRDLCEAVCAQLHPDGTPAEQAFRYLPFVWELAIAGVVAGQKRGLEVPSDVIERLSTSLEFARCLRLPSGELPPVGDEDDGRVLLPAEGQSRLDLVGNCLAALLGAPRVSSTAHCYASLLCGERESDVVVAGDGSWEFPVGGYTVWRRAELMLVWDHGPLGFRSIAAHGHADALSVVLYIGDEPLLADPGTYAYHEDVQARDRFRSTPWHNTVNFGGKDQSENLGPFLWGRKAEIARQEDGYEVRWHSGEQHWRKVVWEGAEVVIEDRIAGDDAEAVFVLGPTVEVAINGCEASLALGEHRVALRSEGLHPWRLEEADFSPRFGHRVPTKRLCGRFSDISATTRILL